MFTGVLRSILNNVRGESRRRHWIVFDGDVDPEWAENLNSVLDDNRLLTLPNGERLAIPDNVRLMFEVHSLQHATLATVSRCGMVWFSEDVVSTDMVLREHLARLRQGNFGSPVGGEGHAGGAVSSVGPADAAGEGLSTDMAVPPAVEHEQSLDQLVRDVPVVSLCARKEAANALSGFAEPKLCPAVVLRCCALRWPGWLG